MGRSIYMHGSDLPRRQETFCEHLVKKDLHVTYELHAGSPTAAYVHRYVRTLAGPAVWLPLADEQGVDQFWDYVPRTSVPTGLYAVAYYAHCKTPRTEAWCRGDMYHGVIVPVVDPYNGVVVPSVSERGCHHSLSK